MHPQKQLPGRDKMQRKETDLLDNGQWKEYMYDKTHKVKWLYNNSNKLTEVVSQKDVWRLILAMDDRIKTLEQERDDLAKGLRAMKHNTRLS